MRSPVQVWPHVFILRRYEYKLLGLDKEILFSVIIGDGLPKGFLKLRVLLTVTLFMLIKIKIFKISSFTMKKPNIIPVGVFMNPG